MVKLDIMFSQRLENFDQDSGKLVGTYVGTYLYAHKLHAIPIIHSELDEPNI